MAEVAEDGTLGDAPVTPIPAGAKFRRGGFKPAAEVIAEAEAVGLPKGIQPAEEVDEVMNAAIAADPNLTFELPEGVIMAGQPGAEEPAEEEPIPAGEKIRIGSREFASSQEALAYAQELEQKNLADEAWKQGFEAAQRNPSAPDAAPQVTAEDPQVTQYREIVRQEMTAAESRRNLWDDFYSKNPDLAHSKDAVQLVYNQSFDSLKNTEVTVALKQIAEKTRSILKPYAQATTPKVTLPKVPATATPGSGNPGIRTPQPQKQALNFAQQLKQHQRSKRSR